MRRTKYIHDFTVIFTFLINVFNQHTDWCARGFSFKHSGEYLNLVSLLALRRKTGRSRFATIQIHLDIGFIYFQPGGTTINNATECRPMAFTEACHRKKFANAIARHALSSQIKIGTADQ